MSHTTRERPAPPWLVDVFIPKKRYPGDDTPILYLKEIKVRDMV